MRKTIFLFVSLASAALCAAGAQWPGLQTDGSVLLHNRWSIRPAGKQVQLGSLPVNIAVHPQGRYAAVADCGYGPHDVLIIDLNSGTVTSRAAISNSFYGLCFSADGKTLYCSGGGDENVHRFDFQTGMITNETVIQIHDRNLRGVPCGLAVNRDSTKLFAANVWGNCVSEVDLANGNQVNDISLGDKPAHLSMAPVVPPSDFETFSAEKRAEVGLYSSDPSDTFPYACCLDEKRQRLYVSLWAQSAVKVVNLNDGTMTNWPAEQHPCEMILNRSGDTLYVANANRNTVTVFDTATGQPVETIWAAFHPDDPPGATPNSLALSPNGKTLFVANANVNAVAVFDVTNPGHSRSVGFIPTGWYPDSVRVTPDGRHLLVANGKGGTAKADLHGPVPGTRSRRAEYIASLFQGTLSIIDLPRGGDWDTQMAAWTAQVYSNIPSAPAAPAADNPIPTKPGDPSPIKYVFYVIKENRTYDQILGDMPQGNGDADICIFPDRSTPNHHGLARQFVLLDNFYADSSVSADGHEWSMGAYASDFVEKMWPMNYGHDRNGKFPYPARATSRLPIPAAVISGTARPRRA
jgi:DNA-binding beta-propeller fold protein YncE